ncbi:hypothetical protein KCU92_g5350, partial [Aureobasidium melanogenum]
MAETATIPVTPGSSPEDGIVIKGEEEDGAPDPATAIIVRPGVGDRRVVLVRPVPQPANEARHPAGLLEDREDSPLASSVFDASFAVSDYDNFSQVRFFNEFIDPSKKHSDDVNELIYAARD